jgi:RNA polymerase sigma-70 factor (ECF subfamily)
MTDSSSSQLQRWLDLLKTGDPAARDRLLEHVCERLRRLTRKLFDKQDRLRSYLDTDDVFQSAMMRLLRAMTAAPPASSAEFFALASRQIRRELIDLARHHYGPQGRGTHEVVASALEAADTPPAVERPDSTYNPEELARWSEFHRKVEALPPEERAVFDLLWYQGLSQEEAAAVLDLSLSTVKRRWLAARLRFQDGLPDTGTDA